MPLIFFLSEGGKNSTQAINIGLELHVLQKNKQNKSLGLVAELEKNSECTGLAFDCFLY